MENVARPKAAVVQFGRWSPITYKLAMALVGAITAVNSLRVVFNLGYNYAAFERSYTAHGGCCIGFLESYVIPITMAFLVSGLLMSRKTRVTMLLSLLGLWLVVLFYFLWYRGTLSILRAAEVANFWSLPNQKQYLLPLGYATWWDIVVLAVALILIGWHLKVFVSSVTSTARR